MANALNFEQVSVIKFINKNLTSTLLCNNNNNNKKMWIQIIYYISVSRLHY